MAYALSVLLTLCGHAAAADTLGPKDWQDIRRDAEQFVRAESPLDVWPFERRHRTAGLSVRKVIAHYFPPFPLSIDNEPAAQDYYAREYLRASGENGKYAAQGGYLRQRPLPTKVWPAHRARETNLAIEVLRAEAIGIDAFGVDLLQIGSGPHWATAVSLLDAAHAVSPTFRIVPEPDMAVLQNVSSEDLEEALATFFVHPASFRLPDGRLLVVPFLAENKSPEFWTTLAARLSERGTPIALLPNLLNAELAATYLPVGIGLSFWGARDASAADDAAAFAARARALKAPSLMLPVAPQDYRPKDGSFWEARNSEAFRRQWETAIGSDASYVHLLTWNDYSESTELAPSSATQFVFYDLCAYYIEAFKSGRAPAITADALYYVHRKQLVAATLTRSTAPTLVGRTPVANDIEVIAFVTSPAVLEIEIGARRVRKKVEPGLSVHRVSAAAGQPVFRLFRAGRPVVHKRGDWRIENAAERFDALYAGGSSRRSAVTVPELPD